MEILNLVKVTFSSNKLFITAIHQLCTGKHVCSDQLRNLSWGTQSVLFKTEKGQVFGVGGEKPGVHWGNSRPPRKDGGKHGEILIDMV